jgi:AraC family transcriptional regulator
MTTQAPQISTPPRDFTERQHLPLAARRSVARGEQVLYGDLPQVGVSVRWHESPDGYDWSEGLGKQTVVLCLNLMGEGTVQCADTLLKFAPGTAGFFFTGSSRLKATRQPGSRHRFIELEFSAACVQRHLSPCDGALHPGIEAFAGGHPLPRPAGETWGMTGAQEACARRLCQPPVFQRARDLWYQGQVLQLMAEYFFERQGEDELFCDRQKRLAHERAQKVMAILQRDLINPPALEAIGREVGCSPFHLSRTFSQEAGMTIPQYLRKLRIERAAEMLESGKYNVTEAAFEVGYSSLSHFSQAFCQMMGCCPGLHPLKTAKQR